MQLRHPDLFALSVKIRYFASVRRRKDKKCGVLFSCKYVPIGSSAAEGIIPAFPFSKQVFLPVDLFYEIGRCGFASFV